MYKMGMDNYTRRLMSKEKSSVIQENGNDTKTS